MDSIKKIIELGHRIQYIITNNNKNPKSFGTKQYLYQSEIHFIDSVGPNDGYNVSSLSNKLGVSKSSITQIANKLVRKNLVIKYKKVNNNKEVYIKLTDEGKIAYFSHLEFHKNHNKNIEAYLNSLSETEKNTIINLLREIENNIPKLENK